MGPPGPGFFHVRCQDSGIHDPGCHAGRFQADREPDRPLGEELVGVSYARQLPASDCDFIERYTRRFNYPEESRIKGKEDIPELGIKTFFCSNVCAAYRRDVYEALGGFSRRTIFNEDMILAGRMVQAGYKVAYAAGPG